MPLFKQFHDEELTALARACVPWEFDAGQVVIKEGDVGGEFFIIVKGEAVVSRSTPSSSSQSLGKKAIKLKSGDYFGEKGLLHDEPRSATITAQTPLSTLSITQASFRESGLINKVHFAHRKAIGGAAKEQVQAHPRTEKTQEQREFIGKALRDNQNLQAFFPLSDQQVNDMIDICWKEDVPEGKLLIQEGDIEADFFYVVDSGKCHILKGKGDEASKAPMGRERSKETSKAGREASKQPSNPSREASKETYRVGKEVSKQPSNASGEARNHSKDSDSSNLSNTSRQSTSLKIAERGASFGEMALFFLAPRSASVVALEDSTVWVFDRYNFKRILMKNTEAKVQEYVEHVNKVQILKSLLADERLAVAQALVEIHFTKDELIMEQGQFGNCFYILFQGEVAILQDGKEVNRIKASRTDKTAVTFGEKALLDNERRTATLKVTSAAAKVLALDRESFNLLLGPLEELIRAGADPARRSVVSTQAMTMRSSLESIAKEKAKQAEQTRLSMNDLRMIGLLGCGAFGFVELYEHRKTHETYALKGLSKGYIVKARMKESALNEKTILLMADSPFVIKLYQTFNCDQLLYFLLEPAMGGELFAVYSRRGFHGSKKHAQFYVAAMLCAFEHLHERHIIYRDLKPENIMLKHTGHAKLTDMGLAKYVIGKTYTTCGTPDYFAPELVQSVGYTNAVDWWSLGILIFELMAGYPPFEAHNTAQTYSKIMKGIGEVSFPVKVRGPVKYLIEGMLKEDPSDRLPMLPKGTRNVTEEKWYEGFDWDAFRKMQMADRKSVV